MSSNRSVSANTITEIISSLTVDVVREENNFFISSSKYKDAVRTLSGRLRTIFGQIFINSDPATVINDYYQHGNQGLSDFARHFSQSIDVLRAVVIQEILQSKNRKRVYHRWVNVLRHSHRDKNYAVLISISSALLFLQRSSFNYLKLDIREEDRGIINAISQSLASPSAMMKEFNSGVDLIPNMPVLLGVVDKLKENVLSAEPLEVEKTIADVGKDLKRIKRRLKELAASEGMKLQSQGSELSDSDEVLISQLKMQIDTDSLDNYYSHFNSKAPRKQFASDSVQSSSSAPNVVERLAVHDKPFASVRRAKTSAALAYDEKASAAASGRAKGDTTRKLKTALSNEISLAAPSMSEVSSAFSLPTDLNPLALPARKPKPRKAKTTDAFNLDELDTPPRRSKSAVKSKLAASAEIAATKVQSASSLPSPEPELVLNVSPVKARRPRKSSAPDKPAFPKRIKEKKYDKGSFERSVSVAALEMVSKPAGPTKEFPTLNPLNLGVLLGRDEASSSAPQATAFLGNVPTETLLPIKESKKEATTPPFQRRNRGFVASQKERIDNASRQEPVATSSTTISSPRAELIKQRINRLVRQAKYKEASRQGATARQRSQTAIHATLFVPVKGVVSHVRRTSSEASLPKQMPAKKK